MFNKLPGSVQFIQMVKDVIVIYRKHIAILILRSLKCYFSYYKNRYSFKVVLNFKNSSVFKRTKEVVSLGDDLR